MSEVTSNPNMLEFPTDIEGVTADLQRVGIRTAQRVHDADQLKLVIAVYKTLLLHTQAVAASNEVAKQEYIREEEARIAACAAQDGFSEPKV